EVARDTSFELDVDVVVDGRVKGRAARLAVSERVHDAVELNPVDGKAEEKRPVLHDDVKGKLGVAAIRPRGTGFADGLFGSLGQRTRSGSDGELAPSGVVDGADVVLPKDHDRLVRVLDSPAPGESRTH